MFPCLTVVTIAGCDTTRNVYRSSTSKKNFLDVKAVTLSHCGCTQIFVAYIKDGKKEFDLFYDDNIARKTIYKYNNTRKTPQKLVLLATNKDDFTTPFDSLDTKIFSLIDSVIIYKRGRVYPLRRTQYRGYINDPYFSH